MKKNLIILGALALMFGATSSPAGAQILLVEFNSTTPWQAGFSQDSTPTSSTTFAGHAVLVTGAAGSFQRTGANAVSNSGSFTFAPLYNGFAYSGSVSTMDLSISGLTAGTQYSLTLYSYDEIVLASGTIVKSLFTPGSATTGTSGTVTYTTGVAGEPTSNSEFSTTLLLTSTTGTIDVINSSTSFNGTIFAPTNADRINGFDLVAVVPEPSSTALMGIGVLAALLFGRRLKFRNE